MTIMATKSRVIVTAEDTSASEDENNDTGLESEENVQQELDNDFEIESEQNSEKESDNESNNSEKESDNESNNSENVVDDDDDLMANAGWADSVAKILKTNRPKGKKTLVLSKAKKLTDVRKPKLLDAGFEVQGEDGRIKRQQIELAEPVDEDKSEEPLRKKRKDIPSVRKKPNILEKDRERKLSKIATKGVVQLFNAVKKQQKDIDVKLQEAGPLEVKRDKVLKKIDKREFLNVLMGDRSRPSNKQQDAEKTNLKVPKKESEGPTWSVLRDDFMMGAKMKDWDKEMEDEESEMEQEVIVESE